MRNFALALVGKYQLNLYSRYEHIIIDYFFAPGGQYQSTWVPFVKEVVPHLHETTILKNGGSVWLPCWEPLVEALMEGQLENTYEIFWTPSESHPLWNPSVAAQAILLDTLPRSFENTMQAPKDGFLRLIPKKELFTGVEVAFAAICAHSRHHHAPNGFFEVIEKLKLGKSNVTKQEHEKKVGTREIILESAALDDMEVGSRGGYKIVEGGRVCLYCDLVSEEDDPTSSIERDSASSSPSIVDADAANEGDKRQRADSQDY